MDTPTCFSCRVEMQAGFIPEFVDSPPRTEVTHWYPDRAKLKSQGTVEAVLSFGYRPIDYDPGKALALDAWRCPKCGRVDFFALRPFVRSHDLASDS